VRVPGVTVTVVGAVAGQLCLHAVAWLVRGQDRLQRGEGGGGLAGQGGDDVPGTDPSPVGDTARRRADYAYSGGLACQVGDDLRGDAERGPAGTGDLARSDQLRRDAGDRVAEDREPIPAAAPPSCG
jgi:hypothetical protein